MITDPTTTHTTVTEPEGGRHWRQRSVQVSIEAASPGPTEEVWQSWVESERSCCWGRVVICPHGCCCRRWAELLDQEPARRDIVVVGAGAEAWDDDVWRDRVRSALSTVAVGVETTEAILASTRYIQADVTKAGDLHQLVAAGPPAPAIFFALPPAVTVACCEALRSVELPEGTVLALEKPFGTDADSAAALNRLVSGLVDDDHVQRVDHFLGRSTVLNILGVRFANRLFEPLWSNQHIESVTIVYDEQLTLENRARYYDRRRRHG